MKLKRLELTNFRIFEQATFDFQPGMNLIVGINGAGKSSVLEALRVLLCHSGDSSIRVITDGLMVRAGSGPPPVGGMEALSVQFTADDFTFGRDNLTGELHFTNENSYSVHATRTPQINMRTKWGPTYRGQGTAFEQAIAIYFSPFRSFLSHREPKKPNGQTRAYEQATVHVDALSPTRGLRVREFTEWMLAQTRLSRENFDPRATRLLRILQSVTSRFLEDYTRLEAIAGQNTIALLDKNENPLNINQLSEGERDLLVLVFDLALYLSQANPKLDDPLRDGEGIVLIDELDLHLQPRWQRTIVEKLTKTFPNCQFIATTHSPQIIGECDPAGLILLTKEDGKVVVTQGGHQGFGLDSSWILEHLMGTAPRNVSVQKRINRVEDAIEEGNLSLARKHLTDLRQTLHGDDGEVVRLEASINNLEALADEVDSETS